MSVRGPMALGLFVLGFGHNIGAWRAAGTEPADILGVDFYIDLARTAERAGLDLIFFAEILYGYELDGRHTGEMLFPTLDPLVLAAALAGATERIGLVGTYSTTYTDPFATAAKLATLDHLSAGRAGWNIVTTGADQSALNFGDRAHPPREDRYAHAAEHVRHVQALWRDWPASPQGAPVRVQAGMSASGRAFAAEFAEVMFTVARTREEAAAFRTGMLDDARAAGRGDGALRVMPGLAPILGATQAEAKAKEEAFFELLHPRIQLALLGDQFGMDFSGFPLDGPMPMQAILNSPRVLSGARDPVRVLGPEAGAGTLGDYLRRAARARAHQAFVGTPEQLADHMRFWFESGACDGFNLMPPVLAGEVALFADQVMPLLRRRGLVAEDRGPDTLRGRLGLPLPPV